MLAPPLAGLSPNGLAHRPQHGPLSSEPAMPGDDEFPDVTDPREPDLPAPHTPPPPNLPLEF